MFGDLCELCFGKKEIIIQSKLDESYPCSKCSNEETVDNSEPSLEE